MRTAGEGRRFLQLAARAPAGFLYATTTPAMPQLLLLAKGHRAVVEGTDKHRRAQKFYVS